MEPTLKNVLQLIAELSNKTGDLHLISFYSDEDGYVSRDRLREDEWHDPSKRIVFNFNSLAGAEELLREYIAELED